MMERQQILATMGELKLFGMKAAYDEIIKVAVKRTHEPQQIVGDLLQAEISEKQARSIKYQVTIAKLPLAKDVDEFTFAGTPINETLVRDLATGEFLAHQRNVVLVGGTGTGKTHLAIAIARACIRDGARGRFFNVVDLVNRLEAEGRSGRQGRMADYLSRVDFIVLDELGYLPFAQSGGQLLFHLISRLYGAGPGLLPKAELGAVAPHAMQDDGELAGDCDPGPRHASSLGNPHAPGAKGRPFLAAHEQRVGCLVERGAGALVAASADLALDVGLAGLIAGRGQAEMRADVPRSPEALRAIDGGPEGESRDRADPRHAHQPSADLLLTNNGLDLLRQAGEPVQHRGQDREERLEERHHGLIVAGELAHAPGEGCAARHTELEAGLAQDGRTTFSIDRISFRTVRRATRSERHSRHSRLFTCTCLNQPVRMICARARASLRSVLFGIVFMAAFACRVSMQIAGRPAWRSSS